MSTEKVAYTLGEQPPQAVVPYYNNGVQVVAASAGNGLIVGNYGLTGGVWTSILAGVAGTRNYVLWCCVSAGVTTEIALRPTGRTGMYLDVYLVVGIPAVFDYRPCGFNKGQIGDGFDIYSSVTTNVLISLLYQNVPAVF